MRKSVSAFVFGLIGSIICLGWGFICGFLGDTASCVASGSSGVPELTAILYLGWICFFGSIAGIIGSSYCLRHARRGAIVLAISTAACSSLLVYIFVKLMQVSLAAGSFVTTTILVLLPVVFMLVATIAAFAAKEVETKDQTPSATVTISQGNQPKTLEQELTDLKGMLDKGLINQEEFDQAKKSILDKHTK